MRKFVYLIIMLDEADRPIDYWHYDEPISRDDVYGAAGSYELNFFSLFDRFGKKISVDEVSDKFIVYLKSDDDDTEED